MKLYSKKPDKWLDIDNKPMVHGNFYFSAKRKGHKPKQLVFCAQCHALIHIWKEGCGGKPEFMAKLDAQGVPRCPAGHSLAKASRTKRGAA